MFEKAKEALQIEADSILELLPRIDDHFGEALKMILHCRGRIIVTGMGKSGIIGRKIAATLASTGTPAFFSIRRKASTGIWAWSPSTMWSWPCPTAGKPAKS